MISLTGQLVGIVEAGKTKEGEDTKPKIQILGDVVTPDGQTRKDLVTVSVKSPQKLSELRDKVGQDITLPVGAFAPSKGSVVFFGL